MALKDQLKEFRTALGMTQEAVAEELGVSSQTVSKWERGLLSPDISMLPRIAVLYRCSLDSLFQMNTVRGIEHRKEFEARIMTELCSHSESPAIREKAKVFYNKIPRLRHSREICAKFVMEGNEYRQQVKQNIIYLIDLAECSVRQLIREDMPPEEKLYYYKKAAVLFETVLDGRYGGFYDAALISNYASIASLLAQIGRREEACAYVERVEKSLERHISDVGRSNISPLLSPIDVTGRASTEELYIQILQAMLENPELAEYQEAIRDILQRYVVFLSATQ